MLQEPDPREVPNEQILTVYSLLRTYIESEDRLLHERGNRTLLVHGFLIASYVLLLQARIEVVAKCLERDTGCKDTLGKLPFELETILVLSDLMLPIIAVIGIFTTIAAQRGTIAAHKAITALENQWIEILKQSPGSAVLRLPHVTAGGHDVAAENQERCAATPLWRLLLRGKRDQTVKAQGENSAKLLLRCLLAMWSLVLLISLCSLLVWNGTFLLRLWDQVMGF